IPSGVSLLIRDPHGDPAVGASVIWDPVGRGAQVLEASDFSDARGMARAIWQLGTDAAEAQQLHVMVDWQRRHWELTLHARAVAATVLVADTSVATVAGGMVRAVRPGETLLHLTVGSVHQTMVIDVQQRVASLRLQRDTIRFDALRDTTTIYAIAQDSLGNPVPNPDLVFEVGDGQVANFSIQRALESLTPGTTVLTLRDAVSGVTASTPVVVDQRIDSIGV